MKRFSDTLLGDGQIIINTTKKQRYIEFPETLGNFGELKFYGEYRDSAAATNRSNEYMNNEPNNNRDCAAATNRSNEYMNNGKINGNIENVSNPCIDKKHPPSNGTKKSYSLHHYFRQSHLRDISVEFEEEPIEANESVEGGCTNCKLLIGSNNCSFCLKLFCLSTNCIRPCDICSEMFCVSCTTTNYSFEFEKLLCIDCDRDVRRFG